MFGVGYRTPAKGSQAMDTDTQKRESPKGKSVVEAVPSEALAKTNRDSLTKVRRSIGEWEAGKAGLQPTTSGQKTKVAHSPPKQRGVQVTSPQVEVVTARKTTVATAAVSLEMESAKPRGRVAEAKACLIKAKLQINSSRNLKAEIKAEVIKAVESLYRLVKEAEASKPPIHSPVGESGLTHESTADLQRALEGHSALAKRNLEVTAEMMRELKQQNERMAAAALDVGAVKDQITHIKVCMERNKVLEGTSYAAVAATKKSADHLPIIPQPVHSVVVSSTDAHDTSDDVVKKIRTAVSARTSGIRVDRLRKARDQKVVLGCQSRDEMTKVMERLKADSPSLLVKEVENRDPLVIMFGVLNFNTDEDVLGALKRQNRHILGSIPEVNYRASVKYRRKARNPLESHVVLQVSPQIWQSLTAAGKAHVDLQRVFVKDQSPLVQCSRCLGYGHGRKNCKESNDSCSHCTGPHLRGECPALKAGEKPTCRNCQSAKLDKTDHNCFADSCPIKEKWDALARARVAYC